MGTKMIKPLILVLLVFSVGCAPQPIKVGVEFCRVAHPIYWDDQEQLDSTPSPVVRRVVAHNMLGERLCAW